MSRLVLYIFVIIRDHERCCIIRVTPGHGSWLSLHKILIGSFDITAYDGVKVLGG